MRSSNKSNKLRIPIEADTIRGLLQKSTAVGQSPTFEEYSKFFDPIKALRIEGGSLVLENGIRVSITQLHDSEVSEARKVFMEARVNKEKNSTYFFPGSIAYDLNSAALRLKIHTDNGARGQDAVIKEHFELENIKRVESIKNSINAQDTGLPTYIPIPFLKGNITSGHWVGAVFSENGAKVTITDSLNGEVDAFKTQVLRDFGMRLQKEVYNNHDPKEVEVKYELGARQGGSLDCGLLTAMNMFGVTNEKFKIGNFIFDETRKGETISALETFWVRIALAAIRYELYKYSDVQPITVMDENHANRLTEANKNNPDYTLSWDDVTLYGVEGVTKLEPFLEANPGIRQIAHTLLMEEPPKKFLLERLKRENRNKIELDSELSLTHTLYYQSGQRKKNHEFIAENLINPITSRIGVLFYLRDDTFKISIAKEDYKIQINLETGEVIHDSKNGSNRTRKVYFLNGNKPELKALFEEKLALNGPDFIEPRDVIIYSLNHHKGTNLTNLDISKKRDFEFETLLNPVVEGLNQDEALKANLQDIFNNVFGVNGIEVSFTRNSDSIAIKMQLQTGDNIDFNAVKDKLLKYSQVAIQDVKIKQGSMINTVETHLSLLDENNAWFFLLKGMTSKEDIEKYAVRLRARLNIAGYVAPTFVEEPVKLPSFISPDSEKDIARYEQLQVYLHKASAIPDPIIEPVPPAADPLIINPLNPQPRAEPELFREAIDQALDASKFKPLTYDPNILFKYTKAVVGSGEKPMIQILLPEDEITRLSDLNDLRRNIAQGFSMNAIRDIEVERDEKGYIKITIAPFKGQYHGGLLTIKRFIREYIVSDDVISEADKDNIINYTEREITGGELTEEQKDFLKAKVIPPLEDIKERRNEMLGIKADEDLINSGDSISVQEKPVAYLIKNDETEKFIIDLIGDKINANAKKDFRLINDVSEVTSEEDKIHVYDFDDYNINKRPVTDLRLNFSTILIPWQLSTDEAQKFINLTNVKDVYREKADSPLSDLILDGNKVKDKGQAVFSVGTEDVEEIKGNIGDINRLRVKNTIIQKMIELKIENFDDIKFIFETAAKHNGLTNSEAALREIRDRYGDDEIMIEKVHNFSKEFQDQCKELRIYSSINDITPLRTRGIVKFFNNDIDEMMNFLQKNTLGWAAKKAKHGQAER